MAYKIPPGLQADVIIYIDGFGWRAVSLTTGIENHQYIHLAEWSAGDISDDIIDDNMLVQLMNSQECIISLVTSKHELYIHDQWCKFNSCYE